MILNEFDAYQEALKKIDLNEEVMPIYKGRLLTENVDIYCKIQKLLGCNAFEGAHRWLYDLDVENLDESECSKVCNLYQLGIDRGLIEPDMPDDGSALSADSTANVAADAIADAPVPADDVPVPPHPIPQDEPEHEAPMAAYTVVYSAMRDGEIKTGEAYSNSLNTRSAKADVISKLEKAGYQNISILAIEAGDPDMAGCDNTFVKHSDFIPDGEKKVEEADLREPLAHSLHPFGVNASTANTAGQDSVRMTLTEEEAKAEVKKTFDEVNKEVGDTTEAADIKKLLDDNKEDIEALKDKLTDNKAKANLDKIVKFLNDYANGKVSEDEEVDEASKGKKSGGTGVGTLARGLVKVLLTLVKLTAVTGGFAGKLIIWATNLLATGADKLNGMLKDSEEDQVNEDGEDEKTGDDSDSDDSEDDKDDSDEAKDDESADDKEDSEDDKKEEDAEEPDEKLKDDKKEEEGKEDASDDKSEKELSSLEKTLLKDSYKKAFKATMQKCKFFDKSFDDLTLEEKVQFFETIDDAWKGKADPSKFMSDKELELIEKIVVKK